MTQAASSEWTALTPCLRSSASRSAFVEFTKELLRLRKAGDEGEATEEASVAFDAMARSSGYVDRQALLAAGLVLRDLVVQGWQVRVRNSAVEVQPPLETDSDHAGEKARIRRQELVKRDAQLRQPAVQKFVQSMERTRVCDGKFVSIFSLMRDGRELASALKQARGAEGDSALAQVVDPYLQFVTSETETCPLTGLRLMDVWRYFRHTWTNQYTSVPGRTMMLLVRDRAARCHPVVGIAAISSPVMQIRERDTWVGWHPDTFLERVRSAPTVELARWLVNITDGAIQEIYVADLLEDELLTLRDIASPEEGVCERLLAESVRQRQLHYQFVQRRDHKGTAPTASGEGKWADRARTHLFRSKRALALATHLRARAELAKGLGSRPTAERLAQFATTRSGSDVIRKVLRKAKADRVGISVADITVCGAVQPYNAILGGKLVAMLATSPEVVCAYRSRYASAESEIASGVAGRAVVRHPNLVLLGTTSLYGVGSSQYNRIKIPCERLGGPRGSTIRYEELGHSESFGTSHYAEDTLDALTDLVQQSSNGQRVNSIFGEGVSPKLRKVREALELLDLPTELLLRHHRHRIVYAVSLVENLTDFLLGLDGTPRYLVPVGDGAAGTARIVEWWRERWLRSRIASDDVLAAVEQHTLVRPIQHGARVTQVLPMQEHLDFSERS